MRAPLLKSLSSLLFLLTTASISFSQSNADRKPSYDSDWWSIIRENSNPENLKPEEKGVAESNFKILGVILGSDDLDAIQRKLGTADVRGRGDAATGRLQICYLSADGKTYLTFETGEVESGFYLFKGGPKWDGMEACAKSRTGTAEWKTMSGLHLGQSQTDVHAILGKPTALLKNGAWIYFRQVQKRTPEADLARLRKNYPNLSDKEFHADYDFYYLTIDIRTKFANNHLVYLGICKSETD